MKSTLLEYMIKIIRRSILVISILLMLCVWPLCLVRKTTEISSNMTTDYGTTEQYICHDIPFVQVFTAQTSRLDYVDFKFSYDQDISAADGNFQINLLDENDNILFATEIGFDEKKDYFWHIDINEWLTKGEDYKLSITVDEEFNNVFRGLYTVRQEDDAPGSKIMCIGAEIIEGQGLARYGYGYPLNIKNVVCIWAFILAVGLSLYFCCGTEQDIKIPKNLGKLWDNLWCLLRKYRMLILLGEMLGIFLMTVYICRNRAVDWDEAYSFMMVTKLSLEEMIHATALDMHPPLYYLLLRVFSSIFGTDFFALKMLSVLINACVMALGITMIRKNWGAKAAFLFILVTGLGPQFIHNAVNIRMYSLALFFVMWSALLAYEISQQEGKLRWVLFVISSLGGVYTHYFAVIPMVLIYGYLMITLLLERRKDFKYFFLCCVMTVVGYLPWIFVFVLDRMKGIDAILGHLPWLSSVISSFAQESTGEGINLSKIDFSNLLEWIFSTNIKFSVVMGVTLFGAAVVMFLLKVKTYSRKKRLFLEMCATNLLLTYVAIALLTSTNTHFFDNRYVYAALGTVWLFVVIIFSEKGRMVSCMLAVNLMVLVLSAYTLQKEEELGTNRYMEQTYNVLEQVREEKVILYNFPTFHILYGAHLPDQEFLSIEEMDWESFDQDYIYLLSWGANQIPWEIQEHYQMQYADCGTVSFEHGYENVRLYRINFYR